MRAHLNTINQVYRNFIQFFIKKGVKVDAQIVIKVRSALRCYVV